MTQKLFKLTSFIFLLYLSLVTPIFAATGVNQTLTFQGKVVNSDGTNVTDGVYDFVFTIYDSAASTGSSQFTESWTSAALYSSTMSTAPSASGESLIYSSNTNEASLKVGQTLWNITKGEAITITSVDTGTNTLGISPTLQAWNTSDTITNQIYVRDGIFRVNLNSLNQSGTFSTIFADDTRFLGINFNTDGEMKPRVRLTSAPYAMNAAALGSIDASGFLRSNTSDNFTSGTLTTDAGTTLDVNGDISIADTDVTFDGATTNFTTTGNFSVNSDDLVALKTSGYVGIGTTNPTQGLEIAKGTNANNSTLRIQNPNASATAYYTTFTNNWADQSFSINQGGTNILKTYGFNDADSMSLGVKDFEDTIHIDTNGLVGIGTTAPSTELQISGTTPFVTIGDADAEDAGIIFDGNAQDYHIGLDDTNDTLSIGLGSALGTTDYLNITSAGYVGIGTTNPNNPLEIYSTTTPQLRIAYSDQQYTTFTTSGAGAFTIQTLSTTGQNEDIELRTPNFDNAIYIDESAASVGIGTTNPLNKLHVEGTGAGVAGIYMNDAVPGTTTNTLYNNGGSLYWNGIAVGSGSYTAGNDIDFNGSQIDIESQLDYVTTISRASSNLALQTTTSGDITLTTGAATGLVNVLTGNLKVGNGTPSVALNGEDAYIEGTLEVDGASQFDGTVLGSSTITAGAAATYDPLVLSPVAKGTTSYTGTITSADLTTTNRTWTFPDATGTVALTSDIPASDNYSSWTLQALTSAGASIGSSAITSADTAAFKESSTIDLAWADDQITFDIVADSIGDTQLAFNTGQHLTTTSTPTFSRLTLSQTTGTSPFVITSTTVNTNLNADLLDGQHASDFQPAGTYDNYQYWTAQDGDTTTYTQTSLDTLQFAESNGIDVDFTADDVLTIAGINAAADGSTKGVAAFTAADFNASTGVISIDYANGQEASGAQDGFLSSTDWTTFNNKQDALGYTAANVALSNLSGVAINTSLISDANNTDDLGSATYSWKDVYLRTGKFDGSTSGTTTLAANAVAGSNTVTLPTGTGTLALTSDIPAAGAPVDATYITQTANGTLTAEQALSSLATGIVQVTTTTGVLSSVTTSAGVSNLLSDETGTGGVMMFNTSPAVTTSLTTGSTSFDLLNTTATTLNFAGAATTLNLGAGGALTRTINLGTGTGADTINIGTGGTTADDINLGGLATSHVDITGVLNFAGGTTYYINNSGTANLNAGTFAGTLTANGTLDGNGIFTLGDNGDTGAIDTSSWDISSAGAASGFTGFSSSGNIDLSALNAGGLVKAAVTTGRLSIATVGTDYQAPLSFENGLTENSYTVKLGGTLTGTTTITQAAYDMVYNLSSTGDFNIQDNGTSVFFVQDDGDIGIGTTDPDDMLHLSGNDPQITISDTADNGNAGIRFFEDYAVSPVTYGFGIAYQGSTNRFNFSSYDGSATPNVKMVIMRSSGYVGIGNTNPGTELQVGGTTPFVTIGDTDAEDAGIIFDGNAQDYHIGLDDTNDTLSIGLGSVLGTTDYLNITSAGNVGIGTTNPLNKLHVQGTGAGSAGIYMNDAVPSTTTNTLYNNAGALYWNGSAVGGGSGITDGTLTGQTVYWDGADWSASNNLFNNGTNVGIGTTNPGAKLDVNGNIYVADGSAGSPAFAFSSDTNTGFYRQSADLLSFVANGQNAMNIDGTSGVGRLMIGNGSPVSRFQINDDNNNAASGITFGGSSSTYLQLYKAGDNKLALMGGWLGIGTTTPTAMLTVNDTAAFNAAGDTEIGYNLNFSNDTAAYIRSASNLTIEAGDTSSAENLTLRSAGSGSVIVGENNIFTNSGQVGIATLTPASNVALDVAGSYQIPLRTTSIYVGANTNAAEFNVNTSNPSYMNRSIYAYAANSGSGGSAYSFYGAAGTFYNAGSAGIGTNAPTVALDVNGLVRVRNPQGETAAPTRSNDGEFGFAYVSSTYRLYFRANGVNRYINSDGAADYSEFFKKIDLSEKLIPGHVITISDQGQATKAYSGSIPLGIVSKYGTKNNDNENGTRYDDPAYTNVGLLGQVPVFVTNENGPVEKGNTLIISTTTPGYAAKNNDQAGHVIGQALQSLPTDNCASVSSIDQISWPEIYEAATNDPVCYRLPNGSIIGRIMTFVKASWYEPNINFDAEGSVALLNQRVDELETEVTTHTNLLTTLSTNLQTLSSTVTNFFTRLTSLEASQSATTIDVAEVAESTDLLSATMADLEASVATLSAGISTESIATMAAVVNQVVEDTSSLTASVAGVTSTVNDLTIEHQSLTTDVATLSARLSYLENRVTGEVAPEPVTVTTTPAPAPEVTTDQVVAVETRIGDLEASLASLSSNLQTSTTAASLTADAETLSLPLNATESALLESLNSVFNIHYSTESASLVTSVSMDVPLTASMITTDSLDTTSLFVADFLSVMGETITTNLTVTNNLIASSITSLCVPLSLQGNLLSLDATGNLVTINGDLTVTGKITASALDTPEITQLASASATLSAEVINLNTKDQTLTTDILDLQQLVASMSAKLSLLESQLATSSATATDSATATSSAEPTAATSSRLSILSQTTP